MGVWADLLGTVRDTFTVGRGTAATTLTINGATSTLRNLRWQTAGLTVWSLRANNAAQSGSNAGSDLVLAANDDSGTAIDTPVTITRAAGGGIELGRILSLLTGGSASAPTLTWTGDADTGLFRIGGNTIGASANSVQQWHWDGQGFYCDRALHLPIVVITSTTTLDQSHHTVLCDATSGSITVNLPAAGANAANNVYVIKKIDSSSNTVVIDGQSGQTIDGALTKTLTAQYEALHIHSYPTSDSYGPGWYIL